MRDARDRWDHESYDFLDTGLFFFFYFVTFDATIVYIYHHHPVVSLYIPKPQFDHLYNFLFDFIGLTNTHQQSVS
ncbi:hypothetical protein QVD17_27238 [Tagetes erecta]|uniref:Uncharacterized protein n=1 Tax=Tagetes erecta TaxID=13708 RepID=A0AAD8NQW5_TARER|nr:hypothetical protein QVD17_27238 [Tagetes erecta]